MHFTITMILFFVLILFVVINLVVLSLCVFSLRNMITITVLLLLGFSWKIDNTYSNNWDFILNDFISSFFYNVLHIQIFQRLISKLLSMHHNQIPLCQIYFVHQNVTLYSYIDKKHQNDYYFLIQVR